MKINFSCFLNRLLIIVSYLFIASAALAQNNTSNDSLKIKYPVKDTRTTPVFGRGGGLFLKNPENIKRTVVYDPLTKKYIIKFKIFRNY